MGSAKDTLTVTDNRSGKTYLHVWALKRTDIADVAVKVSYAPTQSASAPPPRVDPRGSFPYTVPNPPQLAMVEWFRRRGLPAAFAENGPK